VDQFPYPNQNFSRRADAERYPDLRPALRGIGKRTLEGTRAAVRTVIRYRYGVLSGKGASLLDGYMEDLATDRIYRLMIAQRILHRNTVAIMDSEGQRVVHTPEQVNEFFGEELNKIVRALPADTDSSVVDKYRQAREISEQLIARGEFDPI
jgi:malate synthase